MNLGRIEEGALADLIIIDTENHNFISAGSFLANLIYSAHSDCVDSVICGGRFVMRNTIVPGENEILMMARRALDKIM
jgi:5-methylthioadenosine/S-adenosylhomocysteine deaminase